MGYNIPVQLWSIDKDPPCSLFLVSLLCDLLYKKNKKEEEEEGSTEGLVPKEPEGLFFFVVFF